MTRSKTFRASQGMVKKTQLPDHSFVQCAISPVSMHNMYAQERDKTQHAFTSLLQQSGYSATDCIFFFRKVEQRFLHRNIRAAWRTQ
jgi:hypothetical protein